MKTIKVPDKVFADFINLIAVGVHLIEVKRLDSDIGMTPLGSAFTQKEDAAIRFAEKLIKKHQK